MIMWLQRNCTLLRVFFCYFLQIFIVLKAHEREDEWFFVLMTSYTHLSYLLLVQIDQELENERWCE